MNKYGFVRVCAATPEIRVGDVDFNVKNILSAAKEAAEKGAQVIVFPELCITGYTCGDLFNQRALIDAAADAIEYLAKNLPEGPLIFVGAPVEVYGRLYNCAVAFNGGGIEAFIPKKHLPNYGEFYEQRHFCSGENVGRNHVEWRGGKVVYFTGDVVFYDRKMPQLTVSAEICEDLWVPDSPSVKQALAGANIIVNLSCSDEIAGKAEYRRNLVKMQSAKLICGYVYCDAGDGESTTDMVFAGHNLICENGSVLAESKLFENGLLFADIDVDKLDNERKRCASAFYEGYNDNNAVFIPVNVCKCNGDTNRTFAKYPFVPKEGTRLSERTELILNLQMMGLVKRLKHTNAKTAVIGISGGLDSALALLVTCRAFKKLGKELTDIIAVTMPGFGTTGKTFNSSKELSSALGVTLKTVDITGSVLKHFEDIGHDPKVLDVTYENSQARMRTMILMDTANKTGGLVIGTGDLSELALGWATYNGDHMSMYAVNSGVPKTLVKHLIKFEAERLGGKAQKTLEVILSTEISPELLPPDKAGNIAQKTEDIVGPYVLHDFFLYYAVRWGFSPEKVRYVARKTFKDDFSEEVIDKWLKNFYKRFFSQQFKRSCIPDGVKVGTVTLSPRGDWRMPSDASVSLWLSEISD